MADDIKRHREEDNAPLLPVNKPEPARAPQTRTEAGALKWRTHQSVETTPGGRKVTRLKFGPFTI